EPQFRVLERTILVHFTAGKRRWVISASIFPPKQGVDAYAQIFTQILESLNYASNSFPTVSPPTPDSRPTGTPLPLPIFTPWRTPPAPPNLDPTSTTGPTAVPASATPISTINAWLTSSIAAHGYSLSDPDGWLLQEYTPESVLIT